MSASGAGTAPSLTLAGAPSGTLTTFMKPASSSASLSISPAVPARVSSKQHSGVTMLVLTRPQVQHGWKCLPELHS